MDLVNRLKYFMDSIGAPISQFADNCGIPRPSMSQLLNGRNKRISDDVINKIHNAYPQLSILWLMFGEGEMTSERNIELSEAQDRDNSIEIEQKVVEQELIDEPDSSELNFTENLSDNSYSDTFLFDSPVTSSATPGLNLEEPSKADNISFDNREPMENPDTTKSETEISIKPDSGKKITNIVVFYSDNSFQSFMPEV